MNKPIVMVLMGVILGVLLMLIFPTGKGSAYSHSLAKDIQISNNNIQFVIPSGAVLYSSEKLTNSPEVGNVLYVPVTFSPEDTKRLITSEQKAQTHDAYFIKH